MTYRLYWCVYLLCSSLLFLGCQEQEDTPQPQSGIPEDVQLIAQSEATDAQNNRYSVGFEQASGNNQNPFVIKRNAQGDQLWKQTHENTGVDGRAVLVMVDSQGNPWVVFTVDGGSNDAGYITKKEVEDGAFSGVYMNSYGSGGGPKVSLLARLNPDNGKIVKGTFVTARLTNGNTNSLNITKIGLNAGNPAFEISSAAWPPGTGSSYQRFPDITDADRIDGSFKIYYELNSDLTSITTANLMTN